MREVKEILVIGAGFMGAGIAQVAAESGFKVNLNDVNKEIIDKAVAGIFARWESKLERGKIDNETCEIYKNRLNGIADLKSVAATADMVIEAAVENFEIKSTIFSTLNEYCKEDAIIASNTSSISITALAAKVARPENFIGTHFFSPVPAMKLLEIIPGMVTSKDTLETVKMVGEKLRKVCIVSKDSAGFIVNRLLDPMLNEAIQLVDEGVGTIEDIDAGMKFGCAHPMGPLELLDMAGIDIEYAVMQVLYAESGNSKFAPAPLLRKMVRAGFIGKKVGKGFYMYNEDGSKTPNPYLSELIHSK